MDRQNDPVEQKRREVRLRREAAALGMALQKSRARDPDRMDYGRYRVVDIARNCVVAGRFPYGYTLDLDAVEQIIDEIRFDRENKEFMARCAPRPSAD